MNNHHLNQALFDDLRSIANSYADPSIPFSSVLETTNRRATPIKYSSFAQIRGTSSSVVSVKKEDSTIFTAFGIAKQAKNADSASSNVVRGVSE